MQAKSIKLPGPDHPITIRANAARVTVSLAGRIIADTREALTLREASYPAVQYIPLADVVQSTLSHSDTSTYCPFKGDASYYNVTVGGDTVEDAIWFYDQPYPAVADIAGRVAFYQDKAEVVVG